VVLDPGLSWPTRENFMPLQRFSTELGSSAKTTYLDIFAVHLEHIVSLESQNHLQIAFSNMLFVFRSFLLVM
jgi:hypothetical protein